MNVTSMFSQKTVVRRIYDEVHNGRPFWHAPKLAYFFFLSLFPILICLVLSLGILLESRTEARQFIEQYLSTIVPNSASELVKNALRDVISGSSPVKISLAILLTLWSSSRGMSAIMEGLNSAYGIEDKRSWFQRHLVSYGLTLSLLLLVSILVAVMIYSSPFAKDFFEPLGLGRGDVGIILKWLKWPSIIGITSLILGLIYKFAPAERQERVQIAVAISLILWISASMLFRGYLSYSSRFSLTYGFLSSVMILLIWLYLSGLSILLGACFSVAWKQEKPKSFKLNFR